MKKLKTIIVFCMICMLILTSCGNKQTTETTEVTESIVTENEEHSHEEDESIIAKLYEEYTYDNLIYSDYVTLGDYNKLNNLEIATITEEEINAELELYAEYGATEEQITDRPVKEGDIVCCSLTFSEDEKYDYIYMRPGDNIFGQGLESAIINMNAGEEKTVKTIMTENAGFPDYTDKEIEVTVNLTYIVGDTILPELNDEFVTNFTGGEYTTLESFKEYIKEDLTKSRTSESIYNILNELLETSTFENISDLTNEKYEAMKKTYENYAIESNTTYEDMVVSFGFETVDDFHEQLKLDSENMVKQELIIYAIADEIKLELSDEEYKNYAKNLASNYGYYTLTEFLSVEDVSEIKYYCVLQKLVEHYTP